MKKIILMCGPFTSRSGYGDHARSIFYALYDSKKYDIKATPTIYFNGEKYNGDLTYEALKLKIDSLLN